MVDRKVKIGLDSFVSACQSPDTALKPTQALKLWRRIGGRVRTDEFWQMWRREEEARARWAGKEMQ